MPHAILWSVLEHFINEDITKCFEKKTEFTQQKFTCSKTLETLEKGVKYIQR